MDWQHLSESEISPFYCICRRSFHKEGGFQKYILKIGPIGIGSLNSMNEYSIAHLKGTSYLISEKLD